MHLLQSPSYENFQKSLGKTTYTEQGKDWSYLATLEHTPLGPYLMVPRGPYAATSSALRPALSSLKTLARQQKAIFVRIEPEQQIPKTIQKSLRKVHYIHPEDTWILDLTEDKATLLAGMKQNNRNLYNNHAKKGISITHTTDPSETSHLYSLLKSVSEHNHFQLFPPDFYAKRVASGYATLYLAHYQGRVIAAALVCDYGTTRSYNYAAADYAHRSLSAGTILLVQMILDAQAKGLKHFDFWGITLSEDPQHPWHGFTKFKKSFGGYQVSYPGTYDLILDKPRYHLYTLIRPINRALRKLFRKA